MLKPLLLHHFMLPFRSIFFMVKKSLQLITCLLLLVVVISSSAHKSAVFNIKNYGAVNDGKTDNAKAIQQAIDVCNRAGGGRVYVPAGGTFMTGPFNLKSLVELYLEEHALLLANPDEKVYTKS